MRKKGALVPNKGYQINVCNSAKGVSSFLVINLTSQQRNPESSLNRKNAWNAVTHIEVTRSSERLDSSLANLSQILVIISEVTGSFFTASFASFLFADSKVFLTSPDAHGLSNPCKLCAQFIPLKTDSIAEKGQLF